MPKMNDQAFSALFKNEVQNAVNYYDTEFSQDRVDVLSFYMGEPFGNELEGHSKVVATEVSDTIEFIMPSLMKIFGNGDFARCMPRQPEDVASAEQASEYLNFIMNTQNKGFKVIHNWLKDALLFKLGVVKVYYEEHEEIDEQSFEGLNEQELALLTEEENVKIVEQEEVEIAVDEQGEPVFAYNVTVSRTVPNGKIKIVNIPPEEFLFPKRATDLETADFVAHRTSMTVSDLVEMGYDKEVVEQYAGFNELDQNMEKQQRFEQIESTTEGDSQDPALREVLVTEGYMKADYDGDGIAELRRVMAVGESTYILENEPYDKVPFAIISPVLMPHRMVGRSVAEIVMDIPSIKSVLLRQLLDNMYLQNNSRVVAVEGQVNIDDLISVRPGGVVRTRAPGMVQPLNVPQIGPQAFSMLEYMDQVRDQRTGFSKASLGLDPDALQSTTAAAVNATIQGAQAKIEMIARVFAETGCKDLARLILACIVKYMPRTQIIRLRNEFVEMDPRMWATEYDIEVNVGLGTGTQNEKTAMLVQIAGKQEQILQQLGMENPVVSLSQYTNTLSEIAEMAGFKDTSRFFNSGPKIDQQVQQQQQEKMTMEQQAMQAEQSQPDPAVIKAQEELKLKREKMEAEIALEREKMRLNFELRKQELEAELALRAQAAQLGGTVSTNLPRA